MSKPDNIATQVSVVGGPAFSSIEDYIEVVERWEGLANDDRLEFLALDNFKRPCRISVLAGNVNFIGESFPDPEAPIPGA